MPKFKATRLALYISAFVIFALVLFAFFRDSASDITLTKATTLLQERKVKKVIVTKKYVYLKTAKNNYKIPSSQVKPEMFANYEVKIANESNLLLYIVFTILVLGLGTIIVRLWQKKESVFEFKKSSSQNMIAKNEMAEISKPLEAIKTDVSFEDIGGIGDVKAELEEIIDFMKNPKRYKNFGARMPKGVLLVGPPGVGKTMIAKALANAAKVPFYYQSGASFVQIYVGMGAKRVHELFMVAKKHAPSIIFIDEIDAVGKIRDGSRNDEREATLNQLLTEMDGFEGSSGVIVIAATNKIEVLDSALLRAGRFDRRIFVELPTKVERESILEKYISKIPHNLDIKALANMTTGFNGAALAALVNEAALLAIKERANEITQEHFDRVKDKVMFGKKKLQILNETQKAYRVTYQAGKVLIATYHDIPFEKLMLSNEDLTPPTDEAFIQHELEARVMVYIAGMVASHIRYDEHSSSVKSDLEHAKEMVLKMSKEYGMGSSFLGSEAEADEMLRRLYDETKTILERLLDILQNVEEILADKESITKAEVKKYIDAVL